MTAADRDEPTAQQTAAEQIRHPTCLMWLPAFTWLASQFTQLRPDDASGTLEEFGRARFDACLDHLFATVPGAVG
ncbi:hypothetical protein ABT340_20745 [Streptosporangium sp. NPDC000239]|uniref:hypothetical protein n=1 Tax=Streptosporangium sp. NPDC000239 TaxID=3154248 RepID=UPI0033174BF9